MKGFVGVGEVADRQSYERIANDVDIDWLWLAGWRRLGCGPVELEVVGLEM